MGLLTETVDRSRRLAPASKRVYRAAAASFEAFAGARPWTHGLVEAWLDRLRADGLKPQSANRMLVRLKYSSRRLANGTGRPDFAAGAEAFKVKASEVTKRQALSFREIEALLGCCEEETPRGARDHLLVVLGLRTGLRATSMCGLKWSDIHGNEAHVIEKDDQPRIVDLDDDVLQELDKWAVHLAMLKAKRTGHVLRGFGRCSIENEKPRLLERLSPRGAHQTLADLGRRAKIGRNVHPHLLRHSFVTLVLNSGASTQDVMLATGHRSLASLSRYISRTEGKHAPVSSRLPRLDGKS